MSAKRWCFMFIAFVTVTAAAVAAANIAADPFGVFGDRLFGWYAYDMTNNPKVAKFAYVEKRAGEYGAFVIGPSGASGISPAAVERYTGLKCYNMFNYGADMAYTKRLAMYLIENHGPKYIMLVLPVAAAGNYDMPVTDVTDFQPMTPFWRARYLFADPKYALKKLEDYKNRSFVQQPFAVFNAADGTYDKSRRDAEAIGALPAYLEAYPEFESPPAWHIPLGHIEECAAAVGEIARACAERGIALDVVAAPMRGDELKQYDAGEAKRFYQALSGAAPFWSFVNSPVSGDPRYFYDTTHFRNDVGDMMLAEIFGSGGVYVFEGFGRYVTPENAAEAAERDFGAVPGIDNEARISVLNYHNIAGRGDNVATISAEAFEGHIRALSEAGFTAVLPSDLWNYARHGLPLPERPVMITFDDGYQSNYDIAFPILKRYGFRATVFAIGVSFGKDTYKDSGEPITPHFGMAEAAEMAASGLVSIQSHTFDMHQTAPFDESPREGVLRRGGEAEAEYIAAFRADCERQAALIEGASGEAVTALAYPYGKRDTFSAVLLREAGIKMTFTTVPGKNTLVKGLPASLFELKRYTMDDSVSPEDAVRLAE